MRALSASNSLPNERIEGDYDASQARGQPPRLQLRFPDDERLPVAPYDTVCRLNDSVQYL